MRKLKMIIEYDGTLYNGWQIQPNGRSIQEELMKALLQLTGQKITIHGAGRTDAKVHAFGQCASLEIDCGIPTEKFPAAMNSCLPNDIVVTNAMEMPKDFHARYSAKGKQYEYRIINQPYPSAIHRNYAWHLSAPLNRDLMKEAVSIFRGTHDFSQFMASGGDVKDAVRKITRSELLQGETPGEISIVFEGNGFLYKMVRMMVAAVIETGLNKSDKSQLSKRLSLQETCANKWTAPPQGLFLNKVYYDEAEFCLDTPGTMV